MKRHYSKKLLANIVMSMLLLLDFVFRFVLTRNHKIKDKLTFQNVLPDIKSK